MTPAPYPTVILNSFQDPFLGTRRSPVGRKARAIGSSPNATAPTARWMLNQVQHDGVEN